MARKGSVRDELGVVLTAREVMNRLRREGWAERPGKGSHVVFTRATGRVVVPRHTGDIPPGTLRSICRGAGWEYPPQR
jgi:predicted RNA binding protein YcfA (HicA-like mRNA interferase family)